MRLRSRADGGLAAGWRQAGRRGRTSKAVLSTYSGPFGVFTDISPLYLNGTASFLDSFRP